MPEPAELPEVRVLRLQPGDVIVARLRDSVPFEHMERIRKQLEESFPGHKAIITAGMELEVARRYDGTAR